MPSSWEGLLPTERRAPHQKASMGGPVLRGGIMLELILEGGCIITEARPGRIQPLPPDVEDEEEELTDEDS